MLSRLSIAALWLPAGKGLTSWLLYTNVFDVYCGFVTFSFGFLGKMWYLIVSIPDPYNKNIFTEGLKLVLWYQPHPYIREKK